MEKNSKRAILYKIFFLQISIDPTIDKFMIDTIQKSDFSKILNLIKFEKIEFPESELPFVFEVFEFLGNETIKFNDLDPNIEITNDNVLRLIHKQLVCQKYFKKKYYKRN